MSNMHYIQDIGHGALCYNVEDGILSSGSTPGAQSAARLRSDLYTADSPLTDLALDISGSCNLDCVYCYEKDIGRNRGPASIAVLLAAVDLLFFEAGDAPSVSLHFASGEPLICFDLLRAVAEHTLKRAAAMGKRVDFCLNTNGTLLTEEIAQFLREYRFLVRISYDGPDNRHDLLRPSRENRGTARAVRRCLDLLMRYVSPRLVVNSVLPANNRLIEIWKWARSEGIPNLHVIKVSSRPESEMYLKQELLPAYRADLAEIADDLFSDTAYGEPLTRFHEFNSAIWNHVRGVRKRRFCAAGANLLAMASDGGLYPCYRLLGLSDVRLGTVNAKGGEVDQFSRSAYLAGLAPEVKSRPICRECWARYFCGGGCYADSHYFCDSPEMPFMSHCSYIKAETEEALRLYHRLIVNQNAKRLSRLFDPQIGQMLDMMDSITSLTSV